MKILTTRKIEKIDNLTKSLHSFINELPNDSIKKPFEKMTEIHRLNEIRNFLDLPGIITFTSRRPFFPIIPMPEVKPPRGGISAQKEHEHDFFTAHQTATGATICCRTCGKIKMIEAGLAQEEEEQTPKSKEYIKISVDCFNAFCNEASTALEVKEKILNWFDVEEKQ